MLHKSVSSYMNLCQKARTESDRVAKVEGAQALGTVVVAVEEAVVDAAVGLALAVIGLLDLEGAVRQWRAGHLDPAEAALLPPRRQPPPGGRTLPACSRRTGARRDGRRSCRRSGSRSRCRREARSSC